AVLGASAEGPNGFRSFTGMSLLLSAACTDTVQTALRVVNPGSDPSWCRSESRGLLEALRAGLPRRELGSSWGLRRGCSRSTPCRLRTLTGWTAPLRLRRRALQSQLEV